MKTNNIYLKLKLGLVALLLLYLFAALGSPTKAISLEDLRQAMEEDPAVAALTIQSRQKLLSAFQMEEGDFDQAVYWAADSMMDVSELLIVKMENPETAEAAVQAHLEGRLDSFRNYGTNQTDLLEHAILLQQGDYLFYGVSEHVERWEEEFLSCVKG